MQFSNNISANNKNLFLYNVFQVKLFIYTLCTEPWHFVLAEQIRGFSWALTWTGVCNYAAQLSEIGSTATIMGVVSMGAWGIGGVMLFYSLIL